MEEIIMTNNEEYNNLYEKYKSMTNEQLQEIINSGEEYRHIAKQVAKDILNETKTEYKNPSDYTIEENHVQTYDMAKDIHFIKNAMMFFVILAIIGLIGGVIGIVHIANVWSDFLEQISNLSI